MKNKKVFELKRDDVIKISKDREIIFKKCDGAYGMFFEEIKSKNKIELKVHLFGCDTDIDTIIEFLNCED